MIYETIQKDKLQPNANRALLSLIMAEICIDGKPMNDEDAIKKLVQMKKNCVKTIELIKANSQEGDITAIDEEETFQFLIEQYLPKGASREDIEKTLIEFNLPKNMKSMGPLMANLKREFAVVDGNLVKSILTEK